MRNRFSGHADLQELGPPTESTSTVAGEPRCECHVPLGILMVMELIFEIRDAEEGGFCASALGHAIFTEADT